MSGGSKIDNLKYISSFIMSEEAVLTNKHLDKFNEDFNNYSRNKTSIYNDKKINLGLIKKSSVYCILTRVKELHRNLDIFQFDVVEISEYSHFKEGFSAKLVVRGAPKVHNDMESRYPVGTKIELFFNTETQIKELSDKIQNDDLVKQWLNHINDYDKNLPTKLENLKRLVNNNEKWGIKSTEKEIIKGYIRDFSGIMRLIKLEWKLEELNNTVKNIKQDINNLEKNVKNLDNFINNNFGSSSSYNCANITALLGGFVSIIPVVGTIGAALATVASATCALSNA